MCDMCDSVTKSFSGSYVTSFYFEIEIQCLDDVCMMPHDFLVCKL